MATKSQKNWFDALPATKIADCTASDATIIPSWVRALLITVDGNLKLLGRDDDDAVTTFPVVAGQIVPIRPRKVMVGTTATVKLLGG